MMKKWNKQNLKKKLIAGLVVGTFTVGLLAGCQKADDPERPITGSQKNTEEKPDISVNPDVVKNASQNNNQTGYKIYQSLYTLGENICISPYSIYTALAMLSNAAEGETLDELLDLLGYDSEEQLHELNQYMSASSQNQDISVANSVWYDQNRSYSEEFHGDYLPILSEYYSAEGYEADFANPGTADEVNEWVSEKTNGKIDQIIKEISPDWNMLLLNAIYFKGDWKIAFDETNTYDGTFYGAQAYEEVPMMHIYDEEFAYFQDHGMEILRMEYADSNMVMDILIADGEDSFNARQTETGEYVLECYAYYDPTWECFNALTEEEWKDLEEGIANADKTTINMLQLPRFEYASDAMSLKETLQQMGVVKAFDGDAQFDKISEATFVDDVLHKTYIKVDESGTEAAAVTVIETTDNAVLITKTQDFIVDRPFMYIIRDSETGMIYFMGNMSSIH